MDSMVTVGKQGQIVLPVDVRAMLTLTPGDRLHVWVDGNRVVLERRQDADTPLRGWVRNVPHTRSLAAELLAERRNEATFE